VKRRFVRVPYPENLALVAGCKDTVRRRGRSIRGTMMGKPNRAPEPVSRSWSFCAGAVSAGFRKGCRRVTGIGNENDQVS